MILAWASNAALRFDRCRTDVVDSLLPTPTEKVGAVATPVEEERVTR